MTRWLTGDRGTHAKPQKREVKAMEITSQTGEMANLSISAAHRYSFPLALLRELPTGRLAGCKPIPRADK